MECGFDRWLDAKMGALMERDRRSVLSLDEAVKSVAGQPYLALMLFGSYARGDAQTDSDIDVLKVVDDDDDSRSFSLGRFSVSVYKSSRLLAMAQAGSLFVLHLSMEGRIVEDRKDVLRRILTSYRDSDELRIIDHIDDAVSVLELSCDEYHRAWRACHRIGVFFLRTVAYMCAKRDGIRSFSLAEVGRQLGDMNVEDLCSIKRASAPDYARFVRLREATIAYLGRLPRSPIVVRSSAQPLRSWAEQLLESALSYDDTAGMVVGSLDAP